MSKDELVKEWVQPVDQSVLWLCLPPRSGGTLLLRLLDSHPQLHNYPSVFGFDNDKMIWPRPDEIAASPEELLAGLFERMDFTKFDRVGLFKKSSNMPQKNYPIYFDSEWFEEIFRDCFVSSANGRGEFNSLFTAFFNSWRNYQNLYFPKKYVVGHMTMRWAQLPYYTENFWNFTNTYPEGRMLFVARRPDDWMASYIRLGKATSYSGDPHDAAEFYKAYYKYALELSRDKRFKVINFENLVKHPESILGDLVEFLGVEWDSKLLFPSFNDSPWYPNSSFERKGQPMIDKDVIGEGESLEGDDKKAVDTEMWELYRELSRYAV